MERRSTYPIGLGGEYVHTNVYHFGESLGSFGDPQIDFDRVFTQSLQKQENREKEINQKFQQIQKGFTLEKFVSGMMDLQEDINTEMKEIGKVTRAQHLAKDKSEWSPEYLEEQARNYLEPYLASLGELMENVAKKGGFKSEEVDRMIPQVHSLYNRLQRTIDRYKMAAETESPTTGQIRGFVNFFKGEAYEGVIASVAAAALNDMLLLEKENLKVDLTGYVTRETGRRVKVDVAPDLSRWGINVGISVKAPRKGTLKGRYGAGVHHTTVRGLTDMIKQTRLGSPVEADKIKYFLINLVRMKDYSQAFGKPVDGPSRITDYPRYYDFLQKIAKTYASFFIGEYIPGYHGMDKELAKQFDVDIFVVGNHIYKKSELLREIRDGGMDIKFAMGGYLSFPQTYWEQFDNKKRSLMGQTGGDYATAVQADFVKEAANKLLPQPVKISIHLMVR